MEGSVVTNILLPAALALIMFGLGLSLTAADFRRVIHMPKAVLVGLFAQTIALTFLCAVVCRVFNLPPDLAIGMMLLAAAPGGASANIFSHLAHGDLALNITLTAINSVLALVSLPLIVWLSFAYFKAGGQTVPPPFGKIFEVTLLVLAVFSAIAIWKNSQVLVEHAPTIGMACVAFNLLSMSLGYCLPRIVGLSSAQAIAVSMEVGIHNAALAMFIAINILEDGTYAIPAAIYSFVMFVTASIVTVWLNRRHLVASPKQSTK